ncbi:GTP pyrophosphokinase [Acinetobacter schindleri]|uniref:GTP pyrophosphokinase n=1 Tax=Acinetobacter schindleri TaxID=108981 RepID=UPI003F5529EE
MDHKNFDQWYEDNAHLYDSLAQSVVQILKSIMKSEKISFVDVPYRIKAKDSCLGKLKKKSHYSSFEDMTDIAGLRIITLVESDLEKVAKIISENFEIHRDDSGDKADLLGADKFGYRSIHFVYDIGKEREKFPEFSLFKGLCFEIQIRTALSHAWAEIEHDRGYKLGGELPRHLKRRFNLLSGLLETADLEFNRLTEDIENYKEKLKSSNLEDLLDLDINRLSLISYLNLKFIEKGLNPKDFSIKNFDYENNILYKIYKIYNCKKIQDIEEIWLRNIDDVKEDWSKYIHLTPPYFRIFLLEDLRKYLSVYQYIGCITKVSYEIILEYYSEIEVQKLLKEFNLEILDDLELVSFS